VVFMGLWFGKDVLPPNAHGEWRRAEGGRMQTETSNRRPLHCTR
jgi:hypothetical protein